LAVDVEAMQSPPTVKVWRVFRREWSEHMSKRAIALGLAVITVVAALLITYFILQREEPRLTIEQAKERRETELMAIDGVVGVGIGECEGEPCVKVLLENESSDLKQRIPTQLDGYTVDTEVVGSLEALPE